MPLRRTVISLVTVALVGSTSPAFAQQSHLPATLPGLSRDEGTFLVTAKDDGSRVVYFIAQNSRHAILDVDLQVEQRLNALWPVRNADRDEILAYPEGDPIGSARAGLLGTSVVAQEAPVDEAPLAQAPSDEAPVVQAPSETVTVVLRPGDNLTRIARDHGTTVDAILQVNGISDPNRIYAGQSLVIPGNAPAETPVVAEERTAVAADAETAEEPSETYVVKPGDSAIGIARELGVDVDELLALNGVANRNRIYAGQVLTIPAQSS